MGLSKQNVVVVNVAKTESGYSASCDLLDGWVVAVTGDWSDLEREVRDSLDFYIDCAKEDGDSYPEIFDRDYRIEYRFDVQSLLCFYQNIFSFSVKEMEIRNLIAQTLERGKVDFSIWVEKDAGVFPGYNIANIPLTIH